MSYLGSLCVFELLDRGGNFGMEWVFENIPVCVYVCVRDNPLQLR